VFFVESPSGENSFVKKRTLTLPTQIWLARMKLGQNFRGDKLVDSSSCLCQGTSWRISHKYMHDIASFSTLLDFCLNKVLLSFFSSIIVIPFMLSPPSSAQFFTSHCIVLSAARFLSQQGASFFL
jgi:hypothetical protein